MGAHVGRGSPVEFVRSSSLTEAGREWGRGARPVTVTLSRHAFGCATGKFPEMRDQPVLRPSATGWSLYEVRTSAVRRSSAINSKARAQSPAAYACMAFSATSFEKSKASRSRSSPARAASRTSSPSWTRVIRLWLLVNEVDPFRRWRDALCGHRGIGHRYCGRAHRIEGSCSDHGTLFDGSGSLALPCGHPARPSRHIDHRSGPSLRGRGAVTRNPTFS